MPVTAIAFPKDAMECVMTLESVHAMDAITSGAKLFAEEVEESPNAMMTNVGAFSNQLSNNRRNILNAVSTTDCAALYESCLTLLLSISVSHFMIVF